MNANDEELKTKRPLTPHSCQTMDKSVKVRKIEQEMGEQKQASQNTFDRDEKPWNIIIVNDIPDNIDRDKFMSIFSTHGTIQDADILMKTRGYARITYTTEAEATKVWEESKINRIKYDDDVLMITLASEDYCPIEDLPDDCLIEIFTHVTKVEDKLALESVSERWEDLSKKSWRTFTKLEYNDNAQVIIPRAKKYLRKLDVTIKDNSDELLRLLATHCTQIEKIDFSFNAEHHNVKLLNAFFRQNEKLRCLALGFDHMWTTEDVNLKDISDQLQYLDCISIMPASIIRLSKDYSKFRNLQVLMLERIKVKGFNKKTFQNMINLKKLFICESIGHSDHISGLAELEKLEYLSLAGGDLTDDILEKILKNNKKLQYLDISKNRKITDASFKYVSQLPDLGVLIAEGLRITDKYLSHMPSVGLANFNDCPITDQGLEKFLETASNISWLLMRGTRITMKSIMAAVQLTKCTGEFLKIFVNDDIYDAYRKLEIDEDVELSVDTEEAFDDWERTEHYDQYYRDATRDMMN